MTASKLLGKWGRRLWPARGGGEASPVSAEKDAAPSAGVGGRDEVKDPPGAGNLPARELPVAAASETLDTVEQAHKEWVAAQAYFDSVTDPGLIDHAIFLMTAAEKRYMFLLNEARREGLAYGGLAAAYTEGPETATEVRRNRRRHS